MQKYYDIIMIYYDINYAKIGINMTSCINIFKNIYVVKHIKLMKMI